MVHFLYRGVQLPGATSPWWLGCVLWLLIFVYPPYGTLFTSIFRLLLVKSFTVHMFLLVTFPNTTFKLPHSMVQSYAWEDDCRSSYREIAVVLTESLPMDSTLCRLQQDHHNSSSTFSSSSWISPCSLRPYLPLGLFSSGSVLPTNIVYIF